jgi:uncharacterized membrane protein HdeD (DUF308 family)
MISRTTRHWEKGTRAHDFFKRSGTIPGRERGFKNGNQKPETALVVSATIASVYTIAIFMILAGGAEVATGLSAKTWGRFLLWILAGLTYIVVAAFALAQPLVAAAFFTLLLGAGMLATGLVRIYLGVHLEAPIRAPILFAGGLTALVGVLIVAGWPNNSFFILGILLGLDLLFWGAAWIGFGLRLRRL